MKKKIVISLIVICALVALIFVMFLGKGSKSNKETNADKQTEIQGTEKDTSATDWDEGLLEEEKEEEKEQGLRPEKDVQDEQKEEADKEVSEGKESQKEQESDSQKDSDKQKDEEGAVVPQPNTETGWGPIL